MRLSAEQRHALELLASSRNGINEELLVLGHSFDLVSFEHPGQHHVDVVTVGDTGGAHDGLDAHPGGV
jgi:hypothetical protein